MSKYTDYVCYGDYNPEYSTEAHKSYIQTKKWKQIRKEVLERDGKKCVICGSKSRLEIHHKTYENWKNENLDELVTLCKTCHTTVHGISSGDGSYVEMLYFDRDDFINMRFSKDCIFHSEITEEFKNSCSRGYGRIPKHILEVANKYNDIYSDILKGAVATIYTHSFKNKNLKVRKIVNNFREVLTYLDDFKKIMDKYGKEFGLIMGYKLVTYYKYKDKIKVYYIALSPNQTNNP